MVVTGHTPVKGETASHQLDNHSLMHQNHVVDSIEQAQTVGPLGPLKSLRLDAQPLKRGLHDDTDSQRPQVHGKSRQYRR